MIGNEAAKATSGAGAIVLFTAAQAQEANYQHCRIVTGSDDTPAIVSFDGGENYTHFIPGATNGYDMIIDDHDSINEEILLKRTGSVDVTGIFASIW